MPRFDPQVPCLVRMGLLKAIPLGGSGEIGKNCTVIETDDDMIIVDCGISFPHEEHHGVDIVIPDFAYILQNRHKVRGIVITHAHEDHVGALSFLLPELAVPIYATPLTEAMIRSKLEERIKMVDVQIESMKPGTKFQLGDITVEPIRVTHSIPETCAIALHTEHGIVLFTADFKFDAAPVDHITSDVKRLAELGEEGVVLLLCDSTNVERAGWSPSESEVESSFREIFQKSEGRVLVTQFSSNIHRMQQIVNAAKATGRKVSVAGRRMDMTFQMVRNMGYLHVDKGTYIPIEEVSRYTDSEVAIMVTGSQGEQMAALSQMSRGEYSRLQVKEGDTIVYSARPIPGNEAGIWRTVNNLVRRGAKVITDYHSHIHVSGHGYIDEIKEMLNLTKPFYVAPVHGEPRHQRLFEEMLLDMGHKSHRIFCDGKW
ncbi:ribonuclease J [Kamptonema cortianum]|nr:ribonuclease J [Kamptonema cortianum]